MTKEDFKLGVAVDVKMCDGSTKEGVLKGIYEDSKGNVQATVEYEQPNESTFALEDITLK